MNYSVRKINKLKGGDVVLNFSYRFKSKLDECEHIILGLLIAGIYESQKQDIIDHYGIDIIEEAYNNVTNNYGMLLARF